MFSHFVPLHLRLSLTSSRRTLSVNSTALLSLDASGIPNTSSLLSPYFARILSSFPVVPLVLDAVRKLYGLQIDISSYFMKQLSYSRSQDLRPWTEHLLTERFLLQSCLYRLGTQRTIDDMLNAVKRLTI